MLSIYIHIPFCVRKCLYCDFLSFPAAEGDKEIYAAALLKEIETEASRYGERLVDTVFFGGGTPSILQTAHIEKIMDKLKNCYRFSPNPEVTIEVNPCTVDKEKLSRYKTAGINRLSIGAQSLQDSELKALGRIHNAADFFAAFHMAREAGFDNINVDLMSALPGQTTERYLETLLKVTGLKPDHISAYSLIIEEGTPFFDMYGEKEGENGVEKDLPSEEEERRMYEETGKRLEEAGYCRYEISNYALKGRECRHNTTYWRRHDYAGFGLGASSMVENVRWKNTARMQTYLDAYGKGKIHGNVKEEIQRLGRAEQMEEFMFLGLRLTEGVSRAEFFEAFHEDMENIYGPVLQQLLDNGLIDTGERVKLTSYGRDVSNYVMAQFLF